MDAGKRTGQKNSCTRSDTLREPLLFQRLDHSFSFLALKKKFVGTDADSLGRMRVEKLQKRDHAIGVNLRYEPSAIRRTISPAAAKPNPPVMNDAVPKPLAQSSFRLVPGSGSVEQVPLAQG